MKNAQRYDALLRTILSANQIRLFGLDGEDMVLDYQRHVFDGVDEPSWTSDDQRRQWAVQLALDLWASWEVHILKSAYTQAHFGGVHVEQRWLDDRDKGSPPCVLMMNQEIRIPGEQETDAPLDVRFNSQDLLGPVTVSTARFESEGSSIMAWRFYLARPRGAQGSGGYPQAVVPHAARRTPVPPARSRYRAPGPSSGTPAQQAKPRCR